MKKMGRGALPPPPSQPITSGSETESQASDCNPCFPKVRRIIVDRFATPVKKPSASLARQQQTPTTASRRGASSQRTPNRPHISVNSNNEVPKLKIYDPVQVFCRVRPLEKPGDETCININDGKSVTLFPTEASTWKTNVAKEMTFSFEKVYNNVVGQQAICHEVSLPLVQDLLEGKSGLLFAYGVTGSGKTYTMSGTADDPGIMPRSIDALFNSIQDFKAVKYVFKPDRMNGFETQSRADAMLERQKEMTAFMAKTPRLRSTRGNPGLDLDSDQRTRDPTFLPVVNQDSVYSVFITYVEIYNNSVYDLLDESPIEMHKKATIENKILREDANHNIYVNGVTEVEVESSEEALEVFQRGQKRRKIAHTALNTESSRSHSIFNIRLVQAPLDTEGEEVANEKGLICVSQLSLVDLAGSERYGRTGATGDRLKEAGQINKSLMTLRQCMEALRKRQQFGCDKNNTDIVPYRSTKLTHFLKSHFEGEGRVRMILCVNPRAEDYDENIHVMSFAELTQEVQLTRPAPRTEPRIDPMTPGRRKANEIYKEAKKRLVMENIISEDDLPASDTAMVFCLAPPLPLCQITKANQEEVIVNLMRALEQRIRGKSEFLSVIMDKRGYLRSRLATVEGEMESLRCVNRKLTNQLTTMVEDKEAAENVLRTVQFEKSELEIKCEEMEKQLQAVNEQLENERMEARQNRVAFQKDSERLKSDLDLQRELDALKRERQMQLDEAKLKAEYKERDKTIAAVKELISQVEIPDSGRASRSRSRRSAAQILSTSTTSSESDIPSVADKSTRFISARSRFASEPRLPNSPSARSVVPQVFSEPRVNTARTSVDMGSVLDSAAVYSRKNDLNGNGRRVRSQSSDKDKWLEHTAAPVMTVKSGTVFQPVMKKKKSVHKLIKPADLANATTSKYCLRMDTRDSDGDMETQLYKADVLHTVTGGAQVIFNDVEVLRQKSPMASPERKRPSSARTPTRNPYEAEELEGLSAKCAMGIGYNDVANKRSRLN